MTKFAALAQQHSPNQVRRHAISRQGPRRRGFLAPADANNRKPVQTHLWPNHRAATTASKSNRCNFACQRQAHVRRLRGRRLWRGDFFHARSQEGQDLNSQHFQVGPEIHQNLRGNALGFSQQPEQEVLRPNVIVLEAAGLLHRILDDLLGPGRLREFTHSNHVGPALDELLHFQADLAEIDIQLPQHIGGHAAALLDQTEENMLRSNILVVESPRLLVGELHHLAGAIGEGFVHGTEKPEGVWPSRGCEPWPLHRSGILRHSEGSGNPLRRGPFRCARVRPVCCDAR